MNDLKFAFRQLLKNPGFTAVAVLTLALGIGANTAMFSLVYGVLLKPLAYPDSDRLVSLSENQREQGQDFVNLTAPGFTDWRKQSTIFEDLAAYQPGGFELTGAGDPAHLFGIRASASLFPLLRVQPELGRGFTKAEDTFGGDRVAVIAHRLWRERFGGATDVLGKNLTLDGNTYTIVGVMPDGFRFAGLDADVWRPMAFEPWELENRGGHNYQAIGRLKPGVTPAAARAELKGIAERLSQQFELSRGWSATMLPLQEQLVRGSERPLYVLFGAVGFVLLIACSNVANLLLARASGRAREFAIRGALGADRFRIVRQLVLESLLLAGLGAAVGWLLARWGLAAVLKLGAGLPRLENVYLDMQVAGFSILVTVVTGIAFGLAPAWFASRVSLGEVLKDAARGTTAGRGGRIRGSFVASQLALALVLLVGATLMLRSFARIHALDPGYVPDHILTASLFMPDSRFPGNSFSEREPFRKAFLAQVVERAAALPGIESAAVVMGMPLTPVGASMQVTVLNRPEPKPGEPQVSGYSQVSTNYFQTMGITLIRGRHFDGRDALTVVEIALAVVLLVSAGLTLRSLQGLLHVDLGFTTSRLFTFKTNLTPQAYPDAERANRFYELLSAKLESLPGVTAVGAISYLPLSGEAQTVSARKPGAVGMNGSDAPAIRVGWRVVRGQYFEAMRMTLLRGRLFTASDQAGAPLVAVVDATFARRFWPTEDAAIGQNIRFGDSTNAETRTVVGVVRGVKHFGPGKETIPEAYAPLAQLYQRGMYTIVQAGDSLAALAPLIRAKLAEVDSSVPMYFTETLEQRRRDALALPRFTAGLIGAFSALALVLAGVGIFGVTAYSVEQRSREFGIRFSLGAQRSHVAGLVLKRVGWLALLGIAMGVPAAFGVAKLMTSLLFGVAPTDLSTLAITATAMGLTVIAASLVPLIRALRVNPVEALRSE